ncbi:MAG: MYXO-CTERM sorting domain-containing protein, partial [Myxococcota bacterium]|nr:MYXO-CTERM sorting domain-containing protein [Myxococcota bacterium]
VVSGGERERERADGTRSCGGCSSSGAPPTSPLLLLLAFLGARARRFGQRKWRRRVASHDA